jgi:hypothetical protein
MAESLVKRIGQRVTTIGDHVRVAAMHEITLPTSESEKREMDKDPAQYIERLLKQEGHEVREVILPKQLPSGLKPRTHYHIQIDTSGRYYRCQWIWVDDGDPSAF